MRSTTVTGIATESVEDAAGTIPIVTGDQALRGASFDLIKIDVEGMENQVIEGLARTLARSDALVFVEVLMPNRETTVAQLARLGYVFRQSFQRYKRCINLIFAKS